MLQVKRVLGIILDKKMIKKRMTYWRIIYTFQRSSMGQRLGLEGMDQ